MINGTIRIPSDLLVLLTEDLSENLHNLVSLEGGGRTISIVFRYLAFAMIRPTDLYVTLDGYFRKPPTNLIHVTPHWMESVER